MGGRGKRFEVSGETAAVDLERSTRGFERLGRLVGAAGARRAERVSELLVLVGPRQQQRGTPDQSADLDIGLGASGRFAPVDEYHPRSAGRTAGRDSAAMEIGNRESGTWMSFDHGVIEMGTWRRHGAPIRRLPVLTARAPTRRLLGRAPLAVSELVLFDALRIKPQVPRLAYGKYEFPQARRPSTSAFAVHWLLLLDAQGCCLAKVDAGSLSSEKIRRLAEAAAVAYVHYLREQLSFGREVVELMFPEPRWLRGT